MITQQTRYGISTTIPVDHDSAVARTKDALAVAAVQRTGNEEIAPLAAEVRARLVRALETVEHPARPRS
jgi:hypothetical protein